MTDKNVTSSCLLYPNHPDRCTVILAVHKTFSAISLVGCLLVAIVIILLKRYKMFVQKMILAMVISAFFSSISYLIGHIHSEDDPGCKFQAFMMQYFDWATLLWITMITINLLLVVKNRNTSKLLPVFHAVVWLGALFWAIIPLFENRYGKAGIWCWIKQESPGYRFGTWFGPLLVLCVCLLGIYIYIIYSVVQATKPHSGESVEVQNINKRYREELKPLIWYPIIYVILIIPTLMYRIEDASHPDNPPNYALVIIAAISGPSVGACNAIIFAVVNASLKEITWLKIKLQLSILFSRKKQSKVIHNYTVNSEITSVAHSSGSIVSSGYGSSVNNATTDDYGKELKEIVLTIHSVSHQNV